MSGSSIDQKAPISAGFYRLEPGTSLVYEYTYHEMKIIVSGSFDISDETGKKVHAVAGDVFYFPKGAKVRFPPHCILCRGVEFERCAVDVQTWRCRGTGERRSSLTAVVDYVRDD